MRENQKQTIHCGFRVTPDEAAIIEQKMAAAGVKNRSAFFRAMVLNGYLLRLDLPELRKAARLMGRLSNNVNQIARRMNERGNILRYGNRRYRQGREGDCGNDGADSRPAESYFREILSGSSQTFKYRLSGICAIYSEGRQPVNPFSSLVPGQHLLRFTRADAKRKRREPAQPQSSALDFRGLGAEPTNKHLHSV